MSVEKPSPNVTPIQMERMLELVRLLREDRCPGGKILAARMEVDVRTIHRDIEFLRDRLGAPVVYDRKHKRYLLTEPSWFLPQLSLSEGELFSLLVARQVMAQYRGTPVEARLQTIFDKVAGALSEQISVHPDFLGDGGLSFAPLPVLEVREGVWNQLLSAIRKRKTVKICYRSLRSGKTEARNVDPYHILNMQGDWYLFARDPKHDKVCQFQLHRIEELRITAFEFEVSKDFDAKKIVDHSFGAYGSDENMEEIHLKIHGDTAERLMDRRFHPYQKTKKIRGGFEIRFPVSASGNRPYLHVMQWVLGMGSEVEVLSPPELRALIQSELKKMRTRYE